MCRLWLVGPTARCITFCYAPFIRRPPISAGGAASSGKMQEVSQCILQFDVEMHRRPAPVLLPRCVSDLPQGCSRLPQRADIQRHQDPVVPERCVLAGTDSASRCTWLGQAATEASAFA